MGVEEAAAAAPVQPEGDCSEEGDEEDGKEGEEEAKLQEGLVWLQTARLGVAGAGLGGDVH